MSFFSIMKTWIFTYTLALIFLTFMTSCSSGDKDGELVINAIAVAKIKGFDPAFSDDLYSSTEIARVYEGLLQYHYLKRPYELIPNLALKMPEMSDDGLTYTFEIKKGVLFHDDPAFAEGKGRELKAHDFAYSIKRLADPKLQSAGWWTLNGKIVGLNEWRNKNKSAEVVNYNEEIPGIKVIGDYTIQFKLTQPYPQFLFVLAMPFTFAVAKEVVEFYGAEFINHPVGTGPFRTGKYRQSNTITYERNPNFRDEFYPSEGTDQKELLVDKGKKLPLVDKINVTMVIEDNPRWLGFLKGKYDFIAIPKDNFSQVITDDGTLDSSFAAKGIVEEKVVGLDISYIAFNHSHDLFKNNKKLRQAMALAYDQDGVNKLFFNNLSVKAQSLLPPALKGYDPDYKNPYLTRDLAKAKKLLAEAGYPNGKGLAEIEYFLPASTTSRQMAEFFQKNMAEIGIKIKPNFVSWPELQQVINKKTAPLFGLGWSGDYPDAENFFAILYGPNSVPGSNGANYQDENFDRLFEKAKVMQDSDERTAIYEQMYRYLGEEMPLIFILHRSNYLLKHGWLKNYKKHEFNHGMSKYYGIDIDKKKELKGKL